MDASSGGERGESRTAERGHGVVRLVLLGIVAVTAAMIASAGPGQGPQAGGAMMADACSGPALILPPGHPPVPGFGPARPGVSLPPGHPRIEGPVRRAPRLPGLAPSFEAPAVTEI